MRNTSNMPILSLEMLYTEYILMTGEKCYKLYYT